MELINLSLDNINMPEDIIACLGIFDGVHIGHDSVISYVKEESLDKGLKSALITFSPHPDYVLGKVEKERYITPLKEKIKIINKNYKLDYFIIIEFTKELAALSYEEFYKLFLQKIKVIVVGEGFKFGYKNLGSVNELRQLHLTKEDNEVISVTHAVYKNINNKISTQEIVGLLNDGKIKQVNDLGVSYKIEGKVIKGSQIGRTIGYPTANINVNTKYYPVKKGVYAVKVLYNRKCYIGIANYGNNPSFNEIDNPRLEVHIFDFDENIYDKKIKVEFIDFIREETKFSSVDDFLIQIEKDCNKCKDIFGGNNEVTSCRSNG